jgi:glycosyltransferase involved in cell wall biosynthesis
MRERDLGANVRVHRRLSVPFPSSTRQSRAAAPSALTCMGLARTRPDVIHTHSFFGIGLEALATSACRGIPLVGTNHTTIAGFAPHLPVSVDRATAYVVWFYNRCDAVTAPSQSVFDELGAVGLRAPQHVLSNPIDTALFTPASDRDDEDVRGQFGLTRPTITYAGRLGPEKNIEVLIRAMAHLQARGIAAELAIAGHGSHATRLRELSAELGVAARVKFLGTLPQDALARLFRVTDIFAMMSTSETQSMVLLQAMASGVPVVAAAARALPEFVGPTNGILVGPHDSAALAHALARLLASAEQRSRLGLGGRRVAAQYDVGTVTTAWETLYRSLIDGRPSA